VYTVEKFAPFSYKILFVLLNCYENVTSVKILVPGANQSTNHVPYLCIFYSRLIIFNNARHQRGTSFIRKLDMKITIFLKMDRIKKV
jgi:hypothetical protein